ncbi:uncharacterized protein LOC127239902 [Andrographis paniculata]|uniref:uncharacterized protein LOC127239902 n=1 Tax=Andrographis paniculata TaxID=175694 RepID=UPI0021E9A25A|nr:uncharacterized protein LOC127239902 [Andrographis paniculata]
MDGSTCSSYRSGSGSGWGWNRIAWRMRVHSAFRAAMACAIVAAVAIYGPKPIADQIKFAAFSYLTAVIIVLPGATLGDTLGGLWHTLIATVQVVPLSMLGRWAVTGREMGIGGAAVAVAIAAFLVALPESTHITAKRIAFGQIVIVCTDAVQSGPEHHTPYMRPVYVAASTALGAVASTLALLIPYPDLTCYKMQKLGRVYGNNASQRMNLYLRALGARETRTKRELLSQAKPLAEAGAKILQSVRNLQEGMQWEKLAWRQYSKADLADKLNAIDLQLRGIGHSLDSTSDSTVEVIHQEMLSDFLKSVSSQVERKIEQIRCFSPFQSTKEVETRRVEKLQLPSELFQPTAKHGWVFFYFSCIDMLLKDDADNSGASTGQQNHNGKAKSSIVAALKASVLKVLSKEKLEFALKCSLSLGLAVLFGLIFDRRNSRWAGLTIAISFVTGKQAVFTVANTRAQGTAIGSIYGVICCFLFHYEVLKFLAILPWVIFSSFLRYSKMFGQSGGISAAIGALLILGRKNYGSPNEFALARVTEVFIGLSAFLLVELCVQPIRAAELAKNHLCTTLNSLLNCTKETRACLAQSNQTVSKINELREKHRDLHYQVNELKKVIADAENEPDFWYSPFRVSSYLKLAGSLSKTTDLLYFIIHNFELLAEQSKSSNMIKEFYQHINGKLELCEETITLSLQYLQKVNSIESSEDSQGKPDQLRDLEMGKVQDHENQSNTIAENSAAAINNEGDSECDKELTERIIQCLSAATFCFSAFMKEIDEIEISIRELN